MIRTLFLDLESYSEEPIGNGTWNYARHPSTEIILATWCFNDEAEDYYWDLTTGEPMPDSLREALEDPEVIIVMQNGGQFDRTVMRETGLADIPCERICDTMVQALAHGLPGALDKLGMVFGLREDQAKIKEGRALIHFFCKPNRGKRNTRLTHPERWADFIVYGRRDTTAMRLIHTKLPKWNYPGVRFFTHGEQSDEHRIWCLDQKINDRGVMADVELATAAVAAAAAEKITLDDATTLATGGDVTAATQRDKLLQFILSAHGVTLPDMRADTLQRRLDDPDLPWAVKHLLDLRLQSSRNSSAKYKAVLKSVGDDDRLHFTMQFCGAATTGRWSGRVFQPQNMMRPTMKMAAIAEAIEDVKAGLGPMMYSNLPEVLGNCVRGVVIAPKGRKLVAADLKSIEGRGLAWLAGEEYMTQFYHDFDAKRINYDSYQMAYTSVAGGDPAEVNKADRQIGKPIELACFTADTRVVTSNGVKRIVDVQLNDELWDGKQWVAHEGVIDRGVRQVVNVAGIEATPDHLFLAAQQWKPAQQLASSQACLQSALATGLESLKSLAMSEALPEGYVSSLCDAHAERILTGCSITTCEKGGAPAATRALKSNLPTGVKASSPTPTSSPTMTTGDDYYPASQLASRDATFLLVKPMQATAVAASMLLLNGEQAPQVSEPFSPISSHLRGGTSQSLNSIDVITSEGMSLATCGSSLESRTVKTNEQSKSCNSESKNSKPVFDILNAGSRNQFTILHDSGAFVVHNCGYGGGVAAFLTFAAVYHLDLEQVADKIWEIGDQTLLRDCESKYEWAKKKGFSAGLSKHKFAAFEYTKQRWRAARPATVQLWADLAEGFTNATLYNKTNFKVRDGLIQFRRDNHWLRMRLPSGRCLVFLQPKIESRGMSYMGLSRYTRQWGRVFTHGGKLSGILTQAFASDVLRYNMPHVEDHSYEIVLTVHDEAITEAPDTPEFNADHLSALMTRPAPWAPNLPLAADGFEAYRYRKED